MQNESESENVNIPLWLWLLFALVTVGIFASAYWRTGSLLWSCLAVIVEFAIGALYAAGDAFMKWFNEL